VPLGDVFFDWIAKLCLTIYCSGVRLAYLPPYSPDLNPTEECFSWIKHYIRRHGSKFRDLVETGNDEDPYLFLYHALDQVPQSACKGWFRNSGYL
jgi:hypothetical protein